MHTCDTCNKNIENPSSSQKKSFSISKRMYCSNKCRKSEDVKDEIKLTYKKTRHDRKMISLRIPIDILKQIDKSAFVEDFTRNQWIIKAIKSKLA